MAEVIRMPLLSDTMTEGKIVTWNKKVGDKVKADDVLAEVETDKATMEVVGYVDGTLLHVGVPAGQAAKINQVIAVVGKEGEDYKSMLDGHGDSTSNAAATESEVKESSATKDKPTDKKADMNIAQGSETAKESKKAVLQAGAKEIRMPLLSDTMTEGKIVAWNKKLGDSVKADDVLAEVETDKATMEVVGYEEGTLLYIGVEAGKAAKINQIIAIVGKAGTDVSAYVAAEQAGAGSKETKASVATSDPSPQKPEEAKSAHVDTPDRSETEGDQRIKASPLAKKIAEEKGVDISKIKGSGDEGRIVKRDIESYKEAMPAAETGAGEKATMATAESGKESHTDMPLSQMRKTIARRLGESMFTAPHFYLTMEMTMDAAMSARAAINEVSKVKISFNDLIIKACASALRLHPDVNSSFMGDFIRRNDHIHIGSALALPEGLIVPVIRFADQKNLSQIAAEAKDLYGKARDKKLQPADFSGNTFTISNLGMMDIEEFTAIINPPDSCILAVGRIKETVVSREGKFETANVMKVTLSCDHRSVDGAVGAAFLQTLKKFIENPVTMLV